MKLSRTKQNVRKNICKRKLSIVLKNSLGENTSRPETIEDKAKRMLKRWRKKIKSFYKYSIGEEMWFRHRQVQYSPPPKRKRSWLRTTELPVLLNNEEIFDIHCPVDGESRRIYRKSLREDTKHIFDIHKHCPRSNVCVQQPKCATEL